MLLLLLICAAIFGCGMLMPKLNPWLLVAVFLGGVIGLHLALPDGQALRMALGQTVFPSAFLLVMGGIVWGYRMGLSHLRTRAAPVEAPENQPLFRPAELERYARHIIMREIGGPGQKALKEAKVLVVGAGGLGAPALQYLAAAGVGLIGVIDDDKVENSNLQRQVIHKDQAIGMPKVFSAQAEMQAQNPHITVRPYHRRLTPEIAVDLLSEYDLVLDGCDNFETRYLVNETCVSLKKPLISGALAQWEGQLSVFDPARGTPCYQCIFDTAPAAELAPNCSQAGVIGPLPGVIGSMMALEAIKLITGAGALCAGHMLIYDALYGESRKIALKPRATCPICGPKGSVTHEHHND